MSEGPHGNFKIVPLVGDKETPTAVYARVYDDGRIVLAGRNVKLHVKQLPYGRGSTARWAFGDGWEVKPMPWEASAADAGEMFTPEEGK